MYNKRGQVTIFIIIAIVIVGVVVGYFFLRQTITPVSIPPAVQPVYNSFLSCLEDKTRVGINLLESQAGYIQLPAFEPGNAYMPFSSQLNAFGSEIPYWYYVSGNNIQKEQVPSQSDMEKSLANFIDDKIGDCNYDSYYQQGYQIDEGTPEATVSINSNNVNVKLNMNMRITKGEDTVLVDTHQVSIDSNLGNLYNAAKTVYQKEQNELFLENYGVDTMELYAPVDGVDISCSPETWNANQVFSNLREAIETNTLALSTKSPTTKDGKYFYVNVPGVNARFINSQNWSESLEVLPSEGSLLVANPVGDQPGLGIMGFCYVTYHFVYNIKYPVLIQVYNGNEFFQFPVAVVIQGNQPRVALNTTAAAVTNDLCKYENNPLTVSTYDTALNPVNSQISFECLGETCDIGETSSGSLTASFPQCVNGYVIAKTDGFTEARQLFSTNQAGSVSIVMNRLYDLNIDLKLDGASYDGNAVIYFNSPKDSRAVSYPSQRDVELTEGQYNISVYIYKNSSLQLQQSTQSECAEVAASGILGALGVTQKKCFDVTIPSEIVSPVLAGGGTQGYYVTEDQLKNSKGIEINAASLATPTTVEQLQNNYILFDTKTLEVNLE